MSGEFNISTLVEVDEVTDALQFIVYDPDSPDTVKHKMVTEVDLISYLESNIVFTDGLRLNEDRIFAQEPTDAPYTITESGWYQFAYTGTINYLSAKCELDVVTTYGTFGCKANFSDSALAKSFSNQSIVMKPVSSTSATFISSSYGITAWRLAVNTAVGSGAFIEGYVVPGTTSAVVPQLSQNLGRSGEKGWQLMTPTASTGLTPSGATASYLVAGSVFSLDSKSGPHPSVKIRKTSDDSIQIAVTTPNIIYPNATVVSLDLPATAFRVYDGAGTYVTPSGGTYSSPTMYNDGYSFIFTWTESGAFASLSDSNPIGSVLGVGTGQITLS